ncbi:MAG: ASPIC/UnbV domain-containing protein [Planctomycetes bacterium]|nr:ASPIC/UnbV domain-containing protein [Planctomycetota bacterium]
MTSQSPTDTEATDAYRQAWASIQEMTRNQGASWSGREENRLFLNLAGKSFADISSLGGADFADDARGVGTVDWDGDGQLDLVLRSRTAPRVRLMRNQNQNGGHYLALDLQGTQSNRDAIGARVFVTLVDRQLRRTLHAGDSFLAQSSKRLHFGLGDATAIKEVKVIWPDGASESFPDVAVDGCYRLIQGSGAATQTRVRTAKNLAKLVPITLPRENKSVVRIPLIEKISMRDVVIPSFDDPNRTVGQLSGRPILINLWGLDCANCLKEFQAFQRRAKQIGGRGLQIVALSTDPPEKHAKALERIKIFGLEQHAGYTDERFLALLDGLLYEVLGTSTGTPLPTSLLLDSHGNLEVIYQGKLAVGNLLRDVGVTTTMEAKATDASALLFGQRLAKRSRNYSFLAKVFRGVGLNQQALEFEAMVTGSVAEVRH